MARVRVTWIKSAIGEPENQKRTLKALGLRRLNQSVVHEDSGSLRGKINRVRHLVKLEEAST